MISIVERIFFDSLLCLPLPKALEKVKEFKDFEQKEVEVVFVDSRNKEYFEEKNGYNEDFLRVVGVSPQDKKIVIFVAFEINELIEDKGVKNVKN